MRCVTQRRIRLDSTLSAISARNSVVASSIQCTSSSITTSGRASVDARRNWRTASNIPARRSFGSIAATAALPGSIESMARRKAAGRSKLAAEPCRRVLDFFADHLLRITIVDAARTFEQIDQGMKRQRAAKRHRVTFEPAGAITCALMELLQQARLADAWIPDEEHRLAAALLRLCEQVLEQL